MTALVGIKCDGGCGRERIATTYVAAAIGPVRRRARSAGWHKTKGQIPHAPQYGYSRDICPECWKAGKR